MQTPETQPSRVLIIDDEEEIVELLAELFEDSNHVIATSTDPLEGLKKFQENPFDVVVTDLGMPGLTGLEVAKAVKEMNAKTRVVLLTGWGGDVESDNGNYIDHVLEKPIKTEDLLQTVSAILLQSEN